MNAPKSKLVTHICVLYVLTFCLTVALVAVTSFGSMKLDSLRRDLDKHLSRRFLHCVVEDVTNLNRKLLLSKELSEEEKSSEGQSSQEDLTAHSSEHKGRNKWGHIMVEKTARLRREISMNNTNDTNEYDLPASFSRKLMEDMKTYDQEFATQGKPGWIGKSRFSARLPIKRRKSGLTGLDGLPGLKVEWGLPGLVGLPGQKREGELPRLDGLPKQKRESRLVGEVGEAGEMGRPGYNGQVGMPGLDGSPGRKGDKGDSMCNCNYGLNRMDGPHGPPERRGPQDEKRERGDKGWIGKSRFSAQLPVMRRESGLPELDGQPRQKRESILVQKGEKGMQGPPGRPGLDGLPGLPGPVGPQGPKGDKGDSICHFTLPVPSSGGTPTTVHDFSLPPRKQVTSPVPSSGGTPTTVHDFSLPPRKQGENFIYFLER